MLRPGRIWRTSLRKTGETEDESKILRRWGLCGWSRLMGGLDAIYLEMEDGGFELSGEGGVDLFGEEGDELS